MITLARRVRGGVVVAATWAVLWVAFGVLLWAAFRILDPADIGPGEGLARVLPSFAAIGLLSGIGFAVLLTVAERRRALHELSLARVAFWGMLGSAAIPALMGAPPGEGWITGLLG